MSGQLPVPEAGVLGERVDRARMQRHLAPLLVLAMDAQHAILEIDVLALEAERLAEPQPGDSQQPDQRAVRRSPRRWLQRGGCVHQREDLGRRVDIRREALRAGGQQIPGRDLGPLVDRREMPGEPADRLRAGEPTRSAWRP